MKKIMFLFYLLHEKIEFIQRDEVPKIRFFFLVG